MAFNASFHVVFFLLFTKFDVLTKKTFLVGFFVFFYQSMIERTKDKFSFLHKKWDNGDMARKRHTEGAAAKGTTF